MSVCLWTYTFLTTSDLLLHYGLGCLGGLIPFFLVGCLGDFYLFIVPFFPPQTNWFIFFCNRFSMCSGIPCTVVRYCDMPPPNIWTISLRPKIVGLLLPHLSKYSSILSRFFDQMASLSIPFPSQPPRIQIGSFSFAMSIFVSISAPDGVLFWFEITFCL